VNGVGIPSCSYMPNPPFTKEAREAGYKGSVLVESTVGIDGKIANVRVIKSPGLGLDESIITTLKKWKCKPAKDSDGNPVEVRVPIVIKFEMTSNGS